MSLDPLYIAVSWVLLRWHELFTAIGLPADGGLNWALSIIFLVVTARVILFRFFIKQVHYQRKMQELQPKIKKLQEKHKGDKATLQREMMALQQAEGFNPISGCLPMLFQFPIFISLFHVLKHMSAAVSPNYPKHKLTLYTFTEKQTLDAAHAKLFKAPLAASLRESADKVTNQLHGDLTSTRIVIIILVLISAGATVITQRAVAANATTPPEGQAAMIQRLMMFGIPVSVVFSGLIFPLGVLLYWFTSNIWTMGQQFYILRFHPHVPGGAVAAGAVKAAPSKSVAPRPGQRPTKKAARGPSVTPPDTVSLSKNASTDGVNGSKPANGKSGNPRSDDPAPARGADAASSADSKPRASGSAGGGQQAPANRPPAKATPRPQRGSTPGPKRSPSKKRR